MRKRSAVRTIPKRNQWSIYFLLQGQKKTQSKRIHGTKSHTKYGTMALPIGVTSSTACLGWESGTSEQARRRMQTKAVLIPQSCNYGSSKLHSEMIQISINGIESLHYKFFNHKSYFSPKFQNFNFILQFSFAWFRIGLSLPKAHIPTPLVHYKHMDMILPVKEMCSNKCWL